MKKNVMIVMVVVAVAQVAPAGQILSYIAMPIGIGHATDAKGVRYPNAICMKDVFAAVAPLYPYYANVGCEAREVQGSGMFRLSIDANTGRVSQITLCQLREGFEIIPNKSIVQTRHHTRERITVA
jgi:hypothetical protein